jgi:hypothetical protein
MASGVVKVVAVLVIVGGAAAIIMKTSSESAGPAAEAPVSAIPPANAQYVSDSPADILAMINGKGKNAASPSDFIGQWNHEEGWEGAVEAITVERGQETLRIQCLTPSMAGGGYWIVAITGEGHGAKIGDTVRVQGCITDVRSIVAAASITNRFVLSPAKIVLNRGR